MDQAFIMVDLTTNYLRYQERNGPPYRRQQVRPNFSNTGLFGRSMRGKISSIQITITALYRDTLFNSLPEAKACDITNPWKHVTDLQQIFVPVRVRDHQLYR